MVEEVEDYEHIGNVVLAVEQRGYASIPEAATILKLHVNTIRDHVRTGKISSTRVGLREVILMDVLQDYVLLKESGDLHDPDKNPPVVNARRIKKQAEDDTPLFNLDPSSN